MPPILQDPAADPADEQEEHAHSNGIDWSHGTTLLDQEGPAHVQFNNTNGDFERGAEIYREAIIIQQNGGDEDFTGAEYLPNPNDTERPYRGTMEALTERSEYDQDIGSVPTLRIQLPGGRVQEITTLEGRAEYLNDILTAARSNRAYTRVEDYKMAIAKAYAGLSTNESSELNRIFDDTYADKDMGEDVTFLIQDTLRTRTRPALGSGALGALGQEEGGLGDFVRNFSLQFHESRFYDHQFMADITDGITQEDVQKWQNYSQESHAGEATVSIAVLSAMTIYQLSARGRSSRQQQTVNEIMDRRRKEAEDSAALAERRHQELLNRGQASPLAQSRIGTDPSSQDMFGNGIGPAGNGPLGVGTTGENPPVPKPTLLQRGGKAFSTALGGIAQFGPAVVGIPGMAGLASSQTSTKRDNYAILLGTLSDEQLVEFAPQLLTEEQVGGLNPEEFSDSAKLGAMRNWLDDELTTVADSAGGVVDNILSTISLDDPEARRAMMHDMRNELYPDERIEEMKRLIEEGNVDSFKGIISAHPDLSVQKINQGFGRDLIGSIVSSGNINVQGKIDLLQDIYGLTDDIEHVDRFKEELLNGNAGPLIHELRHLQSEREKGALEALAAIYQLRNQLDVTVKPLDETILESSLSRTEKLQTLALLNESIDIDNSIRLYNENSDLNSGQLVQSVRDLREYCQGSEHPGIQGLEAEIPGLVDAVFRQQERENVLTDIIAVDQLEPDLNDEQRNAVFEAVQRAYETALANNSMDRLAEHLVAELNASDALTDEIRGRINATEAIVKLNERESQGYIEGSIGFSAEEAHILDDETRDFLFNARFEQFATQQATLLSIQEAYLVDETTKEQLTEGFTNFLSSFENEAQAREYAILWRYENNLELTSLFEEMFSNPKFVEVKDGLDGARLDWFKLD